MVGRAFVALFLGGLVWISSAHAAEDTVTLRLSQSVVVAGDPVRLDVQLPGSDARIDAILIDPPQTLQKAGSSNNVSIINGRMTQSYTQSFQLVPTQAGILTIGPVQVFLNGRTLRSNVVQLVVQAAGSERQLAIDVTAEPAHVWEGQPFLLRTTIRHGAGFRPVEFVPPSAMGIEHFEGQANLDQAIEAVHVDGAMLSQLTVRDWRVPQGLGGLELVDGSIELEKTGQRATRLDPFAGFFGAGRSRFSQPLPTVRVRVDPLPALPPGLTFAGLVGTVAAQWQNVRSSVDRTKAQLRLAGQGQASSFKLESWVQGGYRIYPDVPDVQHGVGNDGSAGVVVRVALTFVPVNEPDSARPAWFDAGTGQYRTWDLPATLAPHAVTQVHALPAAHGSISDATGAVSELPLYERLAQGLSGAATQRAARGVLILAGLYLLVRGLAALRTHYRSRRQVRALEGTALRAALRVALLLDTRSAWERLYRDVGPSQDALAPALLAALGAALYAPQYQSPAGAVRRAMELHDAR